MKLGGQGFLQSTLLLGFAVGLLAPEAVAGSITVNFQGTVIAPLPPFSLPSPVLVGQTLSGFFTYNPAQPGSSGVYNFSGTNQSAFFSIPAATFSGSNSNLAGFNLYKITITSTGVKGATFDLALDMVNTGGKGLKDTTL